MEHPPAPCDGANNYPRNLPQRTLPPYALDTISHRLDAQAPRLFTDEAHAALDFIDLENSAQDFWPSRIKNAERLREHLGVPPYGTQGSHRCRYLFIHAAHSRDRLKISREMFMLCFTHFQVMPEFVDFLFPFGFRSYPQDFHFSAFRQRTQLGGHWRNTAPITGSADCKLQVCFNLKSVERSDSNEWSIRHCAVHHSFDMKEVRTSWIIVKGDELMKERIESATNDLGPQGKPEFKSIRGAFEASLDTHLILCDWSTENWRWYINSLEDRFQNMTRGTFSAPVRVPTLPTVDTDESTPGPLIDSPSTNTLKFRTFSRTTTQLFSRTPTQMTEKGSLRSTVQHRVSPPQTYTNPDTGISQPLPPDEEEEEDNDQEPKFASKPTAIKAEEESREFSFEKLRKVHKIAEKANEAVLVLKHNSIILAQLKQYYSSVSRRNAFPRDLARSCKDAVDNFKLRIEGLESDVQTQILRLESLLRILEDRKNLVQLIVYSTQSAKLRKHQLHSILDYQNTQANKISTKSMITMTADMKEIARKTKIETVSMKVITVVTLFFLPGTFISSLMSTDVFQSDYKGQGMPDPYARLNPVQIYLALSLPLTAVTLLCWAGFHSWVMRQESQKRRHQEATISGQV